MVAFGVPEFRFRRISLALPPVSKLPDGYGGDADRIPLRAERGRSPIRWRVAPPTQKTPPRTGVFALEAPPGIGPGMKVLQTSALPLGYGAG